MKINSVFHCELCKREVGILTRHHLVPKSRGGRGGNVIMLCVSCKDQIHRLFTNKELERVYNTLEKILGDERVKNYIRWIRKQKKERVTMKLKKRKL
jgi:hypothetical protein